MAKITFGQITLEDPNKSLQELVQIYKGLFINDEFGLPLISMVADVDDEEEYDESEEVEDETEPIAEEPTPQPQAQPQFQQQPPKPPGGNKLY